MDQPPYPSTRRPTRPSVPPFSTPVSVPVERPPARGGARPFFTPPATHAQPVPVAPQPSAPEPQPEQALPGHGSAGSAQEATEPTVRKGFVVDEFPSHWGADAGASGNAPDGDDDASAVAQANAASSDAPDAGPMLDELFTSLAGSTDVRARDGRDQAHADVLETVDELAPPSYGELAMPADVGADRGLASLSVGVQGSGDESAVPHAADGQDGAVERDEAEAAPTGSEQPSGSERARADAGGPMIVDFTSVVGGVPETSFRATPLDPMPLGEGVYSTLAPWTESGSSPDAIEPVERVQGDLRFPELTAYRDLVGSGVVAETPMDPPPSTPPAEDPESWEPVPDSPLLRQIVGERAAAGADAAAIAAIIASVAERVRRGELALPGNAAEGEAAALALALAAILQPGRK